MMELVLCRISNLLLVIFVIILLVSVLSCSDVEYKYEDYEFSRMDGIDFLIDNSDLIVVVNISNSRKQSIKNFDYYFVNSMVADVVYGDVKVLGDEILLSTIPKFEPNNSYGTIIVYEKGAYLCFLSRVSEGVYKPVTPNAIEAFFNGEYLYPIWKQMEAKGEASSGFHISDVKDEILSAINRRQEGP